MLSIVVAALAVAACRPTTGDAPALIQRAIEAVGLNTVGSLVRTSPVNETFNMAFQSDRMYPPYLWTASDFRAAVDWERGMHRAERGTAPNTLVYVTEPNRRAMISSRGNQLVPVRSQQMDERAMDPWLVLADWKAAHDVRVAEQCFYRDYWRTVLTRKGADAEERLFLDPKSFVPVKLERREPHYLWGDVLAEYLWSIWTPIKGTQAIAPQFAYRIADGEVDTQRSYSSFALVPRDSVVGFSIPENATAAPVMSFNDADTVRIGDNTFLLTTRAYTNVVTLERDTVFIIDAQTSAERARGDSVWIGKLFPGKHPLVLVVTDLAWPHISGVRYWVANGVPVISHPASRDFLKKVVDHKWTLKPDLLEQRRAKVKFNFKAVDTKLDLAGGAVKLRPIDGVTSEGALMAFLPRTRFLYSGDYIQPGSPASFSGQYAREVLAAVQRAGFSPERFAAMHVGLTEWKALPRFTGQPWPTTPIP
jgi:hypothetical protein